MHHNYCNSCLTMKQFHFITLSLFFSGIVALSKGQKSDFQTAPGFYAQEWNSLPNPRGMVRDAVGDFLLVSRNESEVYVVFENDGSVAESRKLTNASSLSLTHAVVMKDNYIYASSQTSVYRWPYQPGSREPITLREQEVITNIDESTGWGSFSSRPLAFGPDNQFYVGVNTKFNIPVDTDSNQTRIKRFDIFSGEPWPIDFQGGEVFADGVRSHVGIGFDLQGILWGVDNGVTGEVIRPDLGENLETFNPADELNRFPAPGKHYGYPYCFTGYRIENHTAGTQFAWHEFLDTGAVTDEWCQDIQNVEPPILAIPAHMVPLCIIFYDGIGCDSSVGSFPCSFIGDAFITFHGSTCCDSAPPSGYSVAHLPFNKTTNLPTGEIKEIIFDANKNKCIDDMSRATCFRPVSLQFSTEGHLVVNLDNTGEIIKVYYNGTVHQ